MRRLVRTYCKVCLETTTWEANENRLIQCLDAEHMQSARMVQEFWVQAKMSTPQRLITFKGTVNQTTLARLEEADKAGA